MGIDKKLIESWVELLEKSSWEITRCPRALLEEKSIRDAFVRGLNSELERGTIYVAQSWNRLPTSFKNIPEIKAFFLKGILPTWKSKLEENPKILFTEASIVPYEDLREIPETRKIIDEFLSGEAVDYLSKRLCFNVEEYPMYKNEVFPEHYRKFSELQKLINTVRNRTEKCVTEWLLQYVKEHKDKSWWRKQAAAEIVEDYADRNLVVSLLKQKMENAKDKIV